MKALIFAFVMGFVGIAESSVTKIDESSFQETVTVNQNVDEIKKQIEQIDARTDQYIHALELGAAEREELINKLKAAKEAGVSEAQID